MIEPLQLLCGWITGHAHRSVHVAWYPGQTGPVVQVRLHSELGAMVQFAHPNPAMAVLLALTAWKDAHAQEQSRA